METYVAEGEWDIELVKVLLAVILYVHVAMVKNVVIYTQTYTYLHYVATYTVPYGAKL